MTLQILPPKASPAARLAADRAQGQAGRKSGLGSTTGITVKGAAATTSQLAVIQGVLQEAQAEGAIARVMIACIMAITQESNCSTSAVTISSNGRQVGPFQQDSAWGTEAECTSPGTSCKLFLNGGAQAGTFGWTHYNGSVKAAPGDLASAIEQVQISGEGSLYAQWQTEATATVTAFLGGDLANAGGTTTTSGTTVEPYEFTVNQGESWWDCSGRLATEVGWSRWAQGNVLFFVSDNELRAAAPSLKITGDEDWLLAPPAFEWSPRRPTNKVTLQVAAKRWGVQIGAVVEIAMGLSIDGLLLVTETDGGWVNPVLTVTLERPAPKKLEPAPTTRQVASATAPGGGLAGVSGSSTGLVQACEQISALKIPYGGGHSAPLAQLVKDPRSDAGGLDCSSSCSLALYMAGMFPGTTAIVSGEFATSWGAAGQGRDFTIWANADHVFIEFAGATQFNTSYSSANGLGNGSGPQYFAWGQNGLTDANSGLFTPRHWTG